MLRQLLTNKNPILFLLICLLMLISCQGDNKSSEQKEITNNSINEVSGTNMMIDSIKKIHRYLDFWGHPYYTKPHIDLYEQKMQYGEIQQTAQNVLNYAILLLKDGQLAKAIDLFNRIREATDELKEITPGSKKFYDALAITYLRKGEIDNCVENHTSKACLFPIKGEGVHVNKNGSRNAVEIYLKILEKFPDDVESKWLLNLAYMTLGEYPAKVPKEYLIDPRAFRPEHAIPEFENVAMYLGVDINELAGGIITDDFNNDGLMDLVVSSWGLNHQVRIFFRTSEGTYNDHTAASGLQGLCGGLNMVQTDYNNDGWLDFYIMRGGWYHKRAMGILPNSLIRNNGDGTFTDVTVEAGMYHVSPSQTVTWLDYNNDGWLDVFVGNETAHIFPDAERFACQMYHNNGDGTFTDVAPQLGVNIYRYVKGVSSGDINNDGLMDIYISDIAGPNTLLLNNGSQNGRWSFTNIASSAGVSEPLQSFPTWFFDYDNDGFEDLFVAAFDKYAFSEQGTQLALYYSGQSFKSDVPRLFKNNGNGTFENVAQTMNLARPMHPMGCNYGDIDNDGYLDFYLGTGAPNYKAIAPNRMLRNDSGRSFQDVTYAGNFGHIQKGHGISFADLDNDGDQDIYAVMGGSESGDFFQNALFLNPGNENAWITLKLEGTTTNRAAIGSRVRITCSDASGKKRIIYRTVNSGSSFGANSLQQEIGLGNSVKIDALDILWANGKNQYIQYGSFPVNKKIIITEGGQNPVTLSLEKNEFNLDTNHAHHH